VQRETNSIIKINKLAVVYWRTSLWSAR